MIERAEPAAARRMFGCLYGMVGQGASALPVIPPAVALLSAIQTIIAGLFIFLFGLGVRNMFRLK